MEAGFLTVRLDASDNSFLSAFAARSGQSRSAVVKSALRQLASAKSTHTEPSLSELGKPYFGRHGHNARQAADVKSVIREQLDAKRARR